jgi:hypothetical protein
MESQNRGFFGTTRPRKGRKTAADEGGGFDGARLKDVRHGIMGGWVGSGAARMTETQSSYGNC